MSDQLINTVADYYTAKLEAHGATPAGVDWNGEHGQSVRFVQLLQVVDSDAPFSIIDYGCGYGALLEPLAQRYADFQYGGFDVATAMVEEARRRHKSEPRATFTTELSTLGPVDYTVASGIFNVRLEATESEWRRYVLDTIDTMARVSRRGIAFNALTSHSDADRMHGYLHYADPAALLDHCLRNLSRDVTLHHDYDLYEFTLVVRLDGRPPARPPKENPKV